MDAPQGDTLGYLRLMSIMGHELRTPLTVIRGAATLVLQAHDQLPPPRLLEMLRLIDENSEAMAERIEDMLSVSHLDAGDLKLNLEAVRLRDLVDPAVVSAVRLGQARVDASLGAEADAEVEVDRERALQAIRALLAIAVRNAGRTAVVNVEAVPEPGDAVKVELRYRSREHPRPGDRLEEDLTTAAQIDSAAGVSFYLARGLATAMGGAAGREAHRDGAARLWITLKRGG